MDSKYKKQIVIWILATTFFLAWCWENTIPVSFENFSFTLETDWTFNQTVSDWINDLIIKSYIDASATGFVDSVLISKTSIRWIDLDSFVKENLKSAQKEYGYYSQKSKYISFSCSGSETKGKLESFYTKIRDSNLTGINIYFWQYFFVTNSWWYIVSLGSDDQDLRNDFLDSIPSMKCD